MKLLAETVAWENEMTPEGVRTKAGPDWWTAEVQPEAWKSAAKPGRWSQKGRGNLVEPTERTGTKGWEIMRWDWVIKEVTWSRLRDRVGAGSI